MRLLDRLQNLIALQERFPEFSDFLEYCMEFAGFSTTEMQMDIGDYMQYGGQLLTIQAQRRQAKTSIASYFAIWHLIHNPMANVLILSAGEKLANNISFMITATIKSMDILQCMVPNTAEGDRSSSIEFDIHNALKGRADKSASVVSLGIGSSLEGNRATLMLVDDMEVEKNSRTAEARERLLHIIRGFPSICPVGKIIFLGTPQSEDSIYDEVIDMGFIPRIWTGRYPTADQLPMYGRYLAPMLLRRMVADPSLMTGGGANGDQGQATDPVLQDEATLQRIENVQGEAYFQLQYMLNTSLMDAGRRPLDTSRILLMPFREQFPSKVVSDPLDRVEAELYGRNIVYGQMAKGVYNDPDDKNVVYPTSQLKYLTMTIDPAGGGANGDETGIAIGGILNGNIFVFTVEGIEGGYEEEQMIQLAKIAKYFNVDSVVLESNFGHGTFTHIFKPILYRYHKCEVTEVHVQKAKEARIIDALEPVLGRKALIFDTAIIERDKDSLAYLPRNARLFHSIFFQINNITRDKGSLRRDDRADALALLVIHLQELLEQDQEVETDRLKEDEHKKWLANPTGRPSHAKDIQGNYITDPDYDKPYGSQANVLHNINRRYFK